MAAALQGEKSRSTADWEGGLAFPSPHGEAGMGLIGPEGRKQLRVAGRFAGVGFELAAAILVGYFGGSWIDSQLGTGYVAYVGLTLGIFAGFRSLFQAARSAQSDASDSDSEPPA